MPDTVDRATRSRMMSAIRAKNTLPELKVRRYLHKQGFRYRLHVRSLPGTPDMVMPRFRAVILIHGCFWHSHPGCTFAYRPKSNQSFWRTKLQQNIARDGEVERALALGGWRVITVWECETSDTQLSRLAKSIPQAARGKNAHGRGRGRGRGNAKSKPRSRPDHTAHRNLAIGIG